MLVLRNTTEVVALAITADGGSVVSSGFDGTVRLWDLRNAGRFPVLLQSGAENIDAVAFSPDGKAIATAGRAEVARIWDRAGKLLRSLTAGEAEFDGVNALVFSRDSTRLAAGTDGGVIRLWEVATGKPLAADLSPAPIADLQEPPLMRYPVQGGAERS